MHTNFPWEFINFIPVTCTLHRVSLLLLKLAEFYAIKSIALLCIIVVLVFLRMYYMYLLITELCQTSATIKFTKMNKKIR